MRLVSRCRSVLTAAAAWALAAALAAAQPVTITVWDAIPESGRATFLEIIEDFQRENPGIVVELERVAGGYPAIYEKLLVALLGDVAPNVVHQSNVRSFNLRWVGAFMPLNDYIAADPAMDLSDFYPPFLEVVSLNGNIYGIPYNVSTPITYFWPETLEEAGLVPRAPATWQEVIEFGKKVTRDPTGDGIPTVWGMDLERAPGWIAEAFVGQAGGSTVTSDRTALAFNSPEGLKAFEFLQSLIHEHRIARYPGAPFDDFYGGKLGWAYRSTADLRIRIERGIEFMHPISAGPLPCDVRCYVPIGGGGFYAVDTGTPEQREASYKFLSFLARPDNIARYAAGSGYMAVRRSAVREPVLQRTFEEIPEFLVTYDQLAYAHPETQAPQWSAVIDCCWGVRPTFLDPIFERGEAVKPVLDEAVRRGNLVIQEFLAANPQPAHPPR